MKLGKLYPTKKSVFSKSLRRELEMNTINRQNKRYLDFVSSISPKTNEKRSLLRAFWVGGAICTFGQFIRFMLQFLLGLYGDELAGVTSVILIGIGSFLTGLGV